MAARIVDVKAGMAHSQIVIGDVVTIVDAGDAAPLLAALEREGVRPSDVRRIFITHGDGDHILGVAALRARTGAEVVAHEAERDYIEGRSVPPFSMPKRLMIAMAGRRLVRPQVDRWIRGGEVLDGVEVIHSPGHTPGHICLRVDDALIAGDALNTAAEGFREVPHLMTSDLARSRDAIRRLAQLDVARAFSGHRGPADGAREKLRALAASLPAS